MLYGMPQKSVPVYTWYSTNIQKVMHKELCKHVCFKLRGACDCKKISDIR